MSVTIVQIERFRFERVYFYTVQIEGKPQTEFGDFVARMKVKCPIKLGELLHFIDEIGQKYGVRESNFRHERNSHALPPTYFAFSTDENEENSEYGLRLYCCKLSSEIVILYNGDLKTKHYPDDCPNVAPHFQFSLAMTKKIDKAILDRYMSIDKNADRELLIDEDFEF